ncbi:MAG: hypothetical protein CMQ13_02790 [Gammaproteobacteria bacterium]|nr:hypothetical protein [Gammaproteobacteria bacterium]
MRNTLTENLLGSALTKVLWLTGPLLISLGLGSQAFAANDIIEEVVVTGSCIKGSPEDAELPIDVISDEDLLKTGSPSIVEMIRNLGVSRANLGETNQFTSGGQANEGVATVNLRGLGSSRTLVLINGRRHVADEIVGVDIAAIPKSAIGRVEILKDGAAAVYGSDAIGDVVNFIMREDFDEIGESTTDPKLSLLWRPTDALSMRASVGTSFRVPTIQQLFGNITTVHNMADTGLGGTAFRPSITVGNPNLAPEESTNFNIGIPWAPSDGSLEGFQVDLAYYNYSYEDIITRESHVNLLREDLDALNACMTANAGTLLEAVQAGAGNREQIVRNNTGGLLRVLPNLANANRADVSGFDVSGSYRFDTNSGIWRVGLQAAYLLEYEVANRTDEGVTIFDAVGEYNDDNPVARPLPELKANVTLNWSRDAHRAFFIVKYVDGVNHNFTNGATFFAATAGVAHGPDFQAEFLDSSIDSWITADLNYTYSIGEVQFLDDTSITVGVQNTNNDEPPFVPVITGYDGTLHDPRGRVWSVRVSASL